MIDIQHIIKNISYSAYLRPKTTQPANTRLFFGVYRETEREKSKTGYNLKVSRQPCLQQKRKTPVRNINLYII